MGNSCARRATVSGVSPPAPARIRLAFGVARVAVQDRVFDVDDHRLARWGARRPRRRVLHLLDALLLGLELALREPQPDLLVLDAIDVFQRDVVIALEEEA